MDTQERRSLLLKELKQAKGPLTGGFLSKKFNVSRQIIVGDISVIRAGGATIYATPRGYVMPEDEEIHGIVGIIACKHGPEQMRRELEIIVDNGGYVRDVIVEHPLYGEIRADLMLRNRHDVEVFDKRMQECAGKPLSIVTQGVHLHTIEVPDQESLDRIKNQLRQENICANLSANNQK
ncbi:Transcriptional repressor for NAD biosynthesis [Anaerovibrio sp. JC8]|uniref:transcription repressor NadR n=1 Tax=Anaerovibrio sp. JC8 TaxID=1240085 RepID=UPI000A0A92B4|nr:transcription repressor NadR [Anaerovibrio sp. JC8]ORU00474.1 Transcriptional repressor for NAD biosynthesis [Anaerovibrio sp. JC8]